MGKSLPWFMECFLHPPTNPVTRQLMAEVQGLPEVPGPQTVGSEAYSRILDAFSSRGWPGFEEAFDAVVAPDRADYVSVKRELLRESIFNPKVHERMTRIFTGKSTAAEIFSEMRKGRAQ